MFVLLASFLGILIALLLLTNSLLVAKKRANMFLAAYLFLISFYGLVHYVVMHSSYVFWIAICFVNFSFLFLLPGPVLYLYVRSVLSGQAQLRKKDFWHFLPAFVHLLYLLPWIMNSWETKLDMAQRIAGNPGTIIQNSIFGAFPIVITYSIRAISGLSYILYSLYLIIRYEADYGIVYNKKKIWAANWLYIFLFFQVIMFVIYLIETLLAYINHIPGVSIDTEVILLVIEGIVFLLQQTILITFPGILYNIPQIFNPVQDASSQVHSSVLVMNHPTDLSRTGS